MRKGNTVPPIKPGLFNSTGTDQPSMDETRVIRVLPASQGNNYSGIGNAGKGNKWWA